MDVIYFFKVLFRRKWIILSLSILAVVAAFFFLINKKELFQSLAQYSTGFTAEKVRLVDGSSGIDLFTADVKFYNTIETFKSPQVISNIAYKLLLHDLKYPNKAYKKLEKKQTETELYKAVNRDTTIRILEETIFENKLLSSDTKKEKNLIEYFKLFGYDYETLKSLLLIERVGRTDYLNISFWSEDPNLSALVVNDLGQEFLKYYKNLSSQRTEENAEGIKKMLIAQQEIVDSLGKRLYDEKLKQGSIDPISLSTSAMATVKEIETKLAEEKSKQNEHSNRKDYLTERLNTLQSGSGASSSTTGNNDELIRLTNKKNELVAELSRRGGNDPVLQKKLDDVRTEINLKSASASGRNNSGKAKEIEDLKIQISEENALLNAARSTILDYNSRIRKYTGMANAAPAASDITIEEVKTKLKQENVQLGIVMEKYSQAQGLVKDDPTTNFIQTVVGQPAIGAESKKTLLTMALSGMSMFFLSSVIFLLIEIFDPRVKTPTLFKIKVKFNVLNILNYVPLKKQSEQSILLNNFSGKKFSREILFKNCVRILRHELLISGYKVFLITSTQQGAGKTTVIESLAASLVLIKKKILVIDLNFGNNTITQKHNPDVYIQDLAGIINYNNPVSGKQFWSNSELEGLSVLGCKEGNCTPTEALYDLDMKAFIHLLKNEFDYILIESAALNDFADSWEAAAYVDKVFTVFSAASTVTHADDKSLNFITALNEKNKGFILNNVLKENINF
jgi:succinoglycan biosynthesis transport protein ExoP